MDPAGTPNSPEMVTKKTQTLQTLQAPLLKSTCQRIAAEIDAKFKYKQLLQQYYVYQQHGQNTYYLQKHLEHAYRCLQQSLQQSEDTDTDTDTVPEEPEQPKEPEEPEEPEQPEIIDVHLEDNPPYTGETWEHMPIRPYHQRWILTWKDCWAPMHQRWVRTWQDLHPPPHARTWYTPPRIKPRTTISKHIVPKQLFQNKIDHVKRTNFSMCRTRAWAAHGEKEPKQGIAASIAEGLLVEDVVYRVLKQQGFQPTMPNANYEPNYKQRMADMQMILSGRNVVVHCKSATADTHTNPRKEHQRAIRAARNKGGVFQWKSRGRLTRFAKGPNQPGGYNPHHEYMCFGVTQKRNDGSVLVTLSANTWLMPLTDVKFMPLNNGNPNKRCVKDNMYI